MASIDDIHEQARATRLLCPLEDFVRCFRMVLAILQGLLCVCTRSFARLSALWISARFWAACKAQCRGWKCGFADTIVGEIESSGLRTVDAETGCR